MGGLMMVPWDVWQKNDGGPRYFGSAAEYADLYGFVRAVPNSSRVTRRHFVEAVGSQLQHTTLKSLRLCFKETTTVLSRVVRCKPKSEIDPIVIHLIDWNESEPFRLIIDQTQFFHGSTIVLDLLSPTEYDKELHESVLGSSDFGRLVRTQRLKPERHPDGKLRFQIPALHPWGMVRVSRK